jgi:hypothetical protein
MGEDNTLFEPCLRSSVELTVSFRLISESSSWSAVTAAVPWDTPLKGLCHEIDFFFSRWQSRCTVGFNNLNNLVVLCPCCLQNLIHLLSIWSTTYTHVPWCFQKSLCLPNPIIIALPQTPCFKFADPPDMNNTALWFCTITFALKPCVNFGQIFSGKGPSALLHGCPCLYSTNKFIPASYFFCIHAPLGS